MRWLTYIPILLLGILLPLKCMATLCPILANQCRNINLAEELKQAGADPWEIKAIDAITRGAVTRNHGLSKNPYDILPNGRIGWAHFGGSDPLRCGVSPSNSLTTYGVLYSDYSTEIQLYRWRQIVSSAVPMARRWRCMGKRSSLAAIASSVGSAGLRRILGHDCAKQDSRCDCAVRVYAAKSQHRRRRVQWLHDSRLP